jgi:putative redox protein
MPETSPGKKASGKKERKAKIAKARLINCSSDSQKISCNKFRPPAFIRVLHHMNSQEVLMIAAQVELTQALKQQRQFVARTGSGHDLILDDAAGGTGAKPIEMVAVGLAGCTAFDVITVLRQKYHQKVTGYQVRVEADQAERPPQVFTTVRIHHVVTGVGIDEAALVEAIRLSEEKYCSVGTMVQKTATFHTTHEIVEDTTSWLHAAEPAGVQQ